MSHPDVQLRREQLLDSLTAWVGRSIAAGIVAPNDIALDHVQREITLLRLNEVDPETAAAGLAVELGVPLTRIAGELGVDRKTLEYRLNGAGFRRLKASSH